MRGRALSDGAQSCMSVRNSSAFGHCALALCDELSPTCRDADRPAGPRELISRDGRKTENPSWKWRFSRRDGALVMG
jgi:hypothetical protein